MLEVGLRRLAGAALVDVAGGVAEGLGQGDVPVAVVVGRTAGQAGRETLGEQRPGQLGAGRPALVGVLAGPRPGHHGDPPAVEAQFGGQVDIAPFPGQAADQAAVEDQQLGAGAAAVKLVEDGLGRDGTALRVLQPAVGRREVQPRAVRDGVAGQVDQHRLVARAAAEEPGGRQPDVGLGAVAQRVDREPAHARVGQRRDQVGGPADGRPEPGQLGVGVGGGGDQQRAAPGRCGPPSGQAEHRPKRSRANRRHPSRALLASPSGRTKYRKV
jgi:hypothetical protein